MTSACLASPSSMSAYSAEEGSLRAGVICQPSRVSEQSSKLQLCDHLFHKLGILGGSWDFVTTYSWACSPT